MPDFLMCRSVCRSMKLLLALAVSCLAVPAASAQDVAPPGTGTTAPQSAEPGPEQLRNGDRESSGSEARPPPAAAAPNSTSQSICLLVESAAQAHGLPFEFFARLIWQESRFKPDAVGPRTRGGRRALGISQFMPGTASERGLLDPFDPVAALPKAAEFLHELHARFGNLGLAAAAYNAGPQRLRDWLDGRGGLPQETRNYVLTITGRSADEWAAARGDGDKAPVERASCGELMALLKAQPSPFIGELERRVREGGARPWGVQLSAGFLRERVLAAYAAIQRTYQTVLENRDPIIIENKFRSRGTQNFYQVRVGADTRGSANELCAALRSAGGACLVLRNLRGAVQPL
jgi:Transglycosylase SLT domain/SPOR domain